MRQSILTIDEIEKKNCCGCSGCVSICPVHAIEFKEDSEGFLYPQINRTRCVGCGKCYNLCNSNEKHSKSVIGVFSAKNTDYSILKQSSSGGVSYSLCNQIIKEGGVIYGVCYSNDYSVIIDRAETLEECRKFFGSKYVQSNPCSFMTRIEEDLNHNKLVLCISTSCYIAGLYSYLNEKSVSTTNLLTVDLICHGTPSPKLFSDYISLLKNRYKDFSSFSFRTKEKPWGDGSKGFGCTITRKTGKKIVDSVLARVFLEVFFSNNCLRPNCYNCKYADENKPADITIADFWGIKTEHPEFYDPMGVSAVLIHTIKGESYLKKCSDLELHESTVQKVSRKQGNMVSASQMGASRKQFWETYDLYGFKSIAQNYGGLNFKGYLKHTWLYRLYHYIKYGKKKANN